MEYKMLYILLMAVMTLSVMAPLALAEDSVVANDNETPNLISENSADSSLIAEAAADDDATLAFGEITMARLNAWMTISQERKAELEMKIANLRLIQAKIAAKNNDSKAMKKALEAHEAIINRIQERINRLETDSDKKSLGASAEKLVGLERAIQVHELKIQRLNTRLENANLTDEQRTKIEEKIAKSENATSHLRDIQQAKLDKLKTKLMAVNNITEKEANALIESKREANQNKINAKTGAD